MTERGSKQEDRKGVFKEGKGRERESFTSPFSSLLPSNSWRWVVMELVAGYNGASNGLR
jgi:hypothetical protein